MNAIWPVLEPLLLALVVLAAALYSFRRLLPGSWRHLQVALALYLLRRRSPVLRSLGRRIAPPPRLAAVRLRAACGSTGGCGPCNTCDPR